MFILNISDLSKDLSNYYICNKEQSEFLVKNGFCLLSANFKNNQYFFLNTEKLKNFLLKGGE